MFRLFVAFCVFSIMLHLVSCGDDTPDSVTEITVISFKIDGVEHIDDAFLRDIPQNVSIEITFSSPVKPDQINSSTVQLSDPNPTATETITIDETNTKVLIVPNSNLTHLSKHQVYVSGSVTGPSGAHVTAFSKTFYTILDPTPKQTLLPNDEDADDDNTNDLLSVVQRQTFKYFYDFAHPNSGLARERNTSGDVVTTGGSGFGIMALVVGIERNFITRQDGVDRLNKIVTFLESSDRFHGAFSHWINGNTGSVIPFSTKDNGGDLVETSFLMQGLLTFRQYLQPTDTVGNDLIKRITKLYEEIEWDWYRKDGQNVLYWHWSPNYAWEMNFPLYGYFEEQITYLLAASSPTHGIPKEVYTNGYGVNGSIVKNNTYYGYQLPLGNPSPLFWVHYSYLGMDPHFTDDFANYWTQNTNASLINYSYCVTNPNNYVGYSDECWGLTSSDSPGGYAAHSPSNDLGVISPTAALSSFPYTPEESMKALKFFYYKLGDRLWGPYGFYDAFSISAGWTASSYLAIDQGPIIVMIENYRTGLLWNLFMSCPEVQNGVSTLGFTY